MSIIEAHSSLINRDIGRVVRTSAASGASLTMESSRHAQGWNQIIDERLINWGIEAGTADGEDGLEPPSRAAVEVAVSLAHFFKTEGAPAPPTRAVLAGDGGVVFEWITPHDSVTIKISPDARAELRLFSEGRLVSRDTLV